MTAAIVDDMRALVVRQPWAELIAVGIKTVEVRTWRTHYRGSLLIVAGQKLDSVDVTAYELDPVLPRGVTRCVVDVIDCVINDFRHDEQACWTTPPGSYLWILTRPRRVHPVPIKGRLGLFDVHLDPQQTLGL